MWTICINLDRSPRRREFMETQFRVLDIEVERFAAIDGAASVPAWLSLEFSGPHQLTPGEVGCYASHLMAAQMVVGRCLPHAVILEDDVILDRDFAVASREAIETAPVDWDYIHLAARVKRPVVAVQSLSNGRTLVRYSKLPLNTAAYILSNRGARKLLAPLPRRCPNDVDIRHAWLTKLNVLGIYPAPATQTSDFVSDIGHDPNALIPRHFSPGPFSEAYLKWWTIRSLGLGAYARARLANISRAMQQLIGRDRKRSVPILR